MMRSCLLLFVVASPALGRSLLSDPAPDNCTCCPLLEKFGATKNFGINAGHAVHSLHLEELRKFMPDITENNNVPTVNMDLTSPNAILPYTPARKSSEEKFLDPGLQELDFVLSHMEEKKFDVTNFDALERVAHAFHMKDLWANILSAYDDLKNEGGLPEDVCTCARDAEQNGVLRFMRRLALEVREPDLAYGSHIDDPRKQRGYPIGYRIGYVHHFLRKNQNGQFIDGKRILNPEEAAVFERANKEGMPKLVSTDAWKRWKIIMRMDPAAYRDAAIFLFCTLEGGVA